MQVDELKSAFRARFSGSGEPRVCRAPGRINLLGEHIDYNGLPVLPMTLGQGIDLAYAPRSDNWIHLDNLCTRYPSCQFENAAAIPPSPQGNWENYVKAAVSGLNDALGLDGSTGIDLLVSGNIPTAAGLSSSSALVVATALAYLAVVELSLDSDISRLRLAGILAQAEQYVGTQGGGMDQAVLLLGGEGCACKVDFNPLRTEDVPVFPDHVFVVCDSLVTANKTGAARQRYNEGPITSRLIRAMIERQAQRAFGDEVVLSSIGDLWFGPLCLLDREVKDLLDATFPADRTTLADAARFLGVPESDVRERWLGDLPEPVDGFSLRARARHFLTEYQRVEAGRDALMMGDTATFGALMSESHSSCARDYRVSCLELDRLVELGRAAGSIGSRLTGAGFGGCTIHLVPKAIVCDFMDQIDREYYKNIPRDSTPSARDSKHRFVAVPNGPARYW
jgi:N-acetylgalactosamine kinase